MDSRAELWVGFFSALFDAIGPNRNRLTILQRVLFITWPASWILLIAAHNSAKAGKMVEPFQSVFVSLFWVTSIGAAWLLLTAWAFRERLRSHQWSEALGVRPRILVLLLLTLFTAAVFVYFSPLRQ